MYRGFIDGAAGGGAFSGLTLTGGLRRLVVFKNSRPREAGWKSAKPLGLDADTEAV